MGFNFLRSIDENYRRSVEETAPEDANIIFVDPTVLEEKLEEFGATGDILNSQPRLTAFLDNLPLEQLEELGETLRNHMEGQVPGSMDAFRDDLGELSDKNAAGRVLLQGPAATYRPSDIDGTEYSFVIMPQEYVDSKPDIVNTALGQVDELTPEDREMVQNAAEGNYILFNEEEVEEIIDNMPGSNREWIRFIGYHEGEHIEQDVDPTTLGSFGAEAEADAGAGLEASADGDSDIALAWKDMRALNGVDAGHAISPLLDSGDQTTTLHMQGAANYQGAMLGIVEENYDFDAHEGDATSARELLRENPEAFFSTLNESVESANAGLVSAYNEDPTSYEATGLVVGAQIYTDYMNDFEDAYRRRILDQDVPERTTSTQLIPQEAENQYYVDLTRENEIDLINRGLELNARSVGMRVFNDFDFEAYEGEATSEFQLKDENPEAYFAHQRDFVETLRAEAVEAYEQDPSHENTRDLIVAQYASTLISNRHNADLLQHDPTIDNSELMDYDSLITEEQFRGYLEEQHRRQTLPETETTIEVVEPENGGGTENIIQVEPQIDYEEGPNGTPYTTEVSGIETGEPTVDFETGVSVNGTPMPNVFGQSAAPPPENVSVVDPTQPEVTAETPAMIPPQTDITVTTGARL